MEKEELEAMWWQKKKTESGISPTSMRGTRMLESIDAAGFPFAAIIDRSRAQASMGLVFDEQMFDTRLLVDVERGLGEVEGLVATTAVMSGGASPAPARLWATFRARSKSQRRDDDEFVADLARRSTQLFNAAADADLAASPLTGSQVTELAAYSWSDVQTPAWPPVAKKVEETAEAIVIDEVSHVAFVVDIDVPDVEDQIVEATGAIQVGPRVSLARQFRPGLDGQGTGRRVGVLTVSGEDTPEAVAGVAAVIIDALDPHVQLRVHRLRGRTGLAVATMCGGGVLGWQHLDVVKAVA